MIRLAVIALLLSGLGCSASPTRVHGYGMRLEVPPGWQGTVSHGLVRLRGDGLRLWIRESSSPEGARNPFFRRRSVPTLRLADFGVEQHLGFTLSGRRFAVLLPSRSRPSARALDTANAALRSFAVEAGRYYGQSLAPARFPARTGWHVGARGGTLYAEGGQTETWAATVPYRDAPGQTPPHKTLARLPATGVIIEVMLARDSVFRQGRSFNSLAIRRSRIETNFEGLPSGTGLYRATVRHGSYDVNLWVFFKTARPSREVIARAQQELDSLQFPAWPAG